MAEPKPTLRDGLRSAGFDVRFERGAWVRCLVVERDGAWTGHGADEEAALRDALRRMVRSPHLRELLIESWARAGAASERADAAEERETAATRAELRIPEAPHEVHATPDVDAPGDPEAILASAASTATADLGELVLPSGGSRDPAASAITPARDRRPPAPAALPALPPLAREEALAAVDALLDDVRALHGEVSQLARRPMRLTLLGWIAAGRAIQERVPADVAVSDRVHDLAKEVERYAKLYWPGSVPALQRYASPASCRWLLGAEVEPASWEQVADLAERAVLAEEAAAGTDDDGWADAACLRPRPRAPEAMLQEVLGRLARITSAWEPGVPAPLDALDAGSEVGAELVQLAGRLRWLRGAVLAPERWGEAMGRLRRIADRTGYERSRLAQALDEHHRPHTGSWARELGQDPAQKERRRARRELLRERPDAATSADALARWLASAFEVLSTPELAALLGDQRDAVARVPLAAMQGRRARARLKKLQELCASGDQDPATREGMRDELERARDESADAAADAEAAPGAPDPEEELSRRVLPRVRGRRLLFVGNRQDPHLASTLAAALEPATLDWLVADPRRESAHADRIASGRYDLVLCATGFVSHSTELGLRAACRAAAIPYVRVYKGRLASTLRALDRDLGLWAIPAAAANGAGP